MPYRREILLGLAGVGTLSIAGCTGDSDPDIEPRDLSAGAVCAVCGMVISEHHGPAVQVYYAGGQTDDDEPTTFDSIREFIAFDAQRDRSFLGGFATDYSRVSVEVEIVDGTPYLPTRATLDVFAPLHELVFLIESELHGAMGPDAFPFSDRDDAFSFSDTYGGEIVDWEELPAAVSP